ncbi:MAG: diguanylate cyclase [Nitrospirota bacterium]
MFGAATVPVDQETYHYLLGMETRRAIRYSHFFSLCHLRIDQDDPIARAVVCAVADIVRETIRETDVIGLAEERTLSILLLNTEIHNALQIGERIRTRVADHTFVAEQQAIQLTASLGGVCFPTHGNDAAALLLRADEMLAMARRQGGNQTAIPVS